MSLNLRILSRRLMEIPINVNPENFAATVASVANTLLQEGESQYRAIGDTALQLLGDPTNLENLEQRAQSAWNSINIFFVEHDIRPADPE